MLGIGVRPGPWSRRRARRRRSRRGRRGRSRRDPRAPSSPRCRRCRAARGPRSSSAIAAAVTSGTSPERTTTGSPRREAVGGGLDGVAGAVRLGLDGELDALGQDGRERPVGPADDDDPPGAGRLRGEHGPQHHRPPADGMEDLRQRGAHARAESPGEDHDRGSGHPGGCYSRSGRVGGSRLADCSVGSGVIGEHGRPLVPQERVRVLAPQLSFRPPGCEHTFDGSGRPLSYTETEAQRSDRILVLLGGSACGALGMCLTGGGRQDPHSATPPRSGGSRRPLRPVPQPAGCMTVERRHAARGDPRRRIDLQPRPPEGSASSTKGLRAAALRALRTRTRSGAGGRMSLILDHINGVRDDNRLSNLQIVCPNCAATLDTHCGRNGPRLVATRNCERCGAHVPAEVPASASLLGRMRLAPHEPPTAASKPGARSSARPTSSSSPSSRPRATSRSGASTACPTTRCANGCGRMSETPVCDRPPRHDPHQPLLREGAVGARPGGGRVGRGAARAALPRPRRAAGRRRAHRAGARDRRRRGDRRVLRDPALGRRAAARGAAALPGRRGRRRTRRRSSAASTRASGPTGGSGSTSAHCRSCDSSRRGRSPARRGRARRVPARLCRCSTSGSAASSASTRRAPARRSPAWTRSSTTSPCGWPTAGASCSAIASPPPTSPSPRSRRRCSCPPATARRCRRSRRCPSALARETRRLRAHPAGVFADRLYAEERT